MKYLMLLLISFPALAGINEQLSGFNEIIQAQGKALDDISATDGKKFILSGMQTDIGVSRTGILGLTAVRAASTIELRWSRKKGFVEPIESRLSVPSELDEKGLEHLTETVAQLAERSGKISRTQNLRKDISVALAGISQKLDQIQVTEIAGWRLASARLDLSFSADGKTSFITSAGSAFRIRLEWQIKAKPKSLTPAPLSDASKLVSTLLTDLNAASGPLLIPGFEITRVFVGFGSSLRKNLGLWKYSTGFMGHLAFVPVPQPLSLLTSSELPPVQAIEVNGFEEEVLDQKLRLPWRRSYTVPVNFRTGIKAALSRGKTFASRISAVEFKNWYVSNFKITNDVSKSGAFGLSNVTARGMLEIESKRITP